MEPKKKIKNGIGLLAFLLISVGFFSACKEKEECKNPDSNYFIIGRWKLIEVSVSVNYSQPETTDYSNDNIIFDFQENNKLVISGPIPGVLVVFDDFQEDEHFYEYRIWYDCPRGGDPPPTNLDIDHPERGKEERRYQCTAHSDRDTMSISADRTIGGIIDETGLVTGGDYYRWSKIFIKLN